MMYDKPATFYLQVNQFSKAIAECTQIFSPTNSHTGGINCSCDVFYHELSLRNFVVWTQQPKWLLCI